jgi:uncharacterized phage-associated protein
MARIPFDINKSINAIKLVLSNLDNHACDFHKLFKIFYFAEREHLATYGRPITWDRYIAMKDGPVPSTIYDILKLVRGDSIFTTTIDFSEHIEVYDKYFVRLKNGEINLNVFSQSELECLTKSIDEHKLLSFAILREKSHDLAWNAATRDDNMSLFDIASAGGADSHLINYIAHNIENRNAVIQ